MYDEWATSAAERKFIGALLSFPTGLFSPFITLQQLLLFSNGCIKICSRVLTENKSFLIEESLFVGPDVEAEALDCFDYLLKFFYYLENGVLTWQIEV